ncbi:MAG: hypothetical protein COT14_03795 [Candidatus Diapherotrites archaeon CG08_land_8_20_14_0_20_30_16]|nr:MAG: hypothetical protein COT14_03795 [Candidatus Diapherotrites archaeon CG08_land_8_20_14_0_20_30_16]
MLDCTVREEYLLYNTQFGNSNVTGDLIIIKSKKGQSDVFMAADCYEGDGSPGDCDCVCDCGDNPDCSSDCIGDK